MPTGNSILKGSGYAKCIYFKKEDAEMLKVLQKAAEANWFNSVSEYIRKAVQLQFEYDVQQYPEIFNRKDSTYAS